MENEKRWIKRIKGNGSETAANELVSKYYKEMYAFIYKQTLNTELSLDLTQELFISILKSIQNYDSKKASFRTWLYKLASPSSNSSISYAKANLTSSHLTFTVEDIFKNKSPLMKNIDEEGNEYHSRGYRMEKKNDKTTILINYPLTSYDNVEKLKFIVEGLGEVEHLKK